MRERRQVPRYQFRGVGQVRELPEGDAMPVTFITLSTKGCRVRGAGVPRTGQTCLLSFEWEGREFEGEVRVAWKHPQGGAGLLFLPLSDEQLDFIRRLCAGLTLEIPPPHAAG